MLIKIEGGQKMTGQSYFTLSEIFEQLNAFKDKKRAHHNCAMAFITSNSNVADTLTVKLPKGWRNSKENRQRFYAVAGVAEILDKDLRIKWS